VGKLHEVLAVEGDLRSTAGTVIKEAEGTFDKRPAHFLQIETRTEHFAEGDRTRDSSEHKKIETTVADKLAYVGEMVRRYYDCYLQKESANQQARANVEVDGKAFLSDVPVVVLLGMEQRLKELRDMYEKIPTLQPGPTWVPEPSMGVGVYRSQHDDVRFVTKKTKEPVIMYPATDKHPAQVQVLDTDVPIARRITTNWSGMLSVYDKSMLLDRIDTLIQAFKRARMRANEVEAPSREMGEKIFEFLHGPIAEPSS
jgi:hypothetical protein